MGRTTSKDWTRIEAMNLSVNGERGRLARSVWRPRKTWSSCRLLFRLARRQPMRPRAGALPIQMCGSWKASISFDTHWDHEPRNAQLVDLQARHLPVHGERIAQCFKHWVSGVGASSPVGTAECGCCGQLSQPSLRDSSSCLSQPSVETLGYYRLSLRDVEP